MAETPEKDEKTEEATPRRRQEGREKGQVAYSTEAVAAVMLVATLVALVVGGGNAIGAAGEFLVQILASIGIGAEEISVRDGAGLLTAAVRSVIPGLAIIVVPTLLLGLLSGFAQAGFQIAPKAVAFDPAKINPIKGMQRMFSARSVVRTSLAALKILAIGIAITVTASLQLPRVTVLAGLDPQPVIASTGTVLLRCAIAGVLAMAVIASLDLFFQRVQHEKDLRMTKKEIRDEMKNTDGDPHVKSRIRQIQREVASRRMMAEIPKATVVVTNPTHYSVALAYDRSESGLSAPTVVAKGVDHVALRIREVAREHGIPIHEAPPLARALHAQVEIGDPIPEELYQAVAGVLAYVYRLQGETSAHGSRAGA